MDFIKISLIVLLLCTFGGFFLIFRKIIKIKDGSYDEIFEARRKIKELNLRIKECQKKLEELEQKDCEIEFLKERLLSREKSFEQFKMQYSQAKEELKATLLRVSGLSEEKIKQELCALIEDDLLKHKAKMIRIYENAAKSEARKRANYIIAQATTRYCGDFALERLVNIVTLPNDDLKGRVIGRDGRNIKAFEMITGVDVIIDETPLTIVLSSFNLYRRAIATRVLELLIEDRRIQPSRIEEVFKRVSEEMEEGLLQEGEDALLSLGLSDMHPELKKLVGKMKYRASFGQNALGHSLEVARLAGTIAGELGGDVMMARRAGLLHDIGKSLTQDYGGNHVDLGYEICLKYQENPIVLNAIKSHHGDEEVKSIEAAAVCCADTLSAARPGARREALENFLKRSVELEAMIMKKLGVKQAYVINSGKEIRVIVDWMMIGDDECVVMAQEIAREIEESFQYPGEIKVHIIRESRFVEMAH